MPLPRLEYPVYQQKDLLIPTLRNDTISLNVHYAYPPESVIHSEIVAKSNIQRTQLAIIFLNNFPKKDEGKALVFHNNYWFKVHPKR
ncbi:hypothetical protein Vspart_01600 [Vibrio spartinae]|uniref:Uncharacterized protein n=1 Tax=Vibrio spartinae TaxID=1918945 RepID=A0ABX6QZC2_9VIBR|nr:hypothetical protein Vspart_01600 [Vibrio spartinae]